MTRRPRGAAPSTPSSWSSRPATAPTTRCWSGPPSAASRSGATSSWPGGCATRSRRRPSGCCVTGTNGKTTTTQLTADHARRGRPACRAGRQHRRARARRGPRSGGLRRARRRALELPAALAAPRAGAELSPLASVCLNIADDHLDWHGSARRTATRRPGSTRTPGSPASTTGPTRRRARWSRRPRCSEGCRAIGFGLGRPRPERLRHRRRASSSTAPSSTSAHRRARARDPRRSAGGRARRPAHGRRRARGRGARPRGRGRAGRRSARRSAASASTPTAPSSSPRRRRRLGRRLEGDERARRHAALSAYPSVVWIAGGLLKGVDPAPLVARHAGRLRAAVLIGDDRSVLRRGVRATRARRPA